MTTLTNLINDISLSDTLLYVSEAQIEIVFNKLELLAQQISNDALSLLNMSENEDYKVVFNTTEITPSGNRIRDLTEITVVRNPNDTVNIPLGRLQILGEKANKLNIDVQAKFSFFRSMVKTHGLHLTEAHPKFAEIERHLAIADQNFFRAKRIINDNDSML